MLSALPYAELWCLDFEFIAKPGERPDVVCLVARELRNGREIRQWRDEMTAAPPYDVGEGSLFITYNAIAEVSCHLALGWPMPRRVPDLYAEFKNHTNGIVPSRATGLVSPLNYFGLPSISAAEKTAMRDLVLRGRPWTAEERQAIFTPSARWRRRIRKSRRCASCVHRCQSCVCPISRSAAMAATAMLYFHLAA